MSTNEPLKPCPFCDSDIFENRGRVAHKTLGCPISGILPTVQEWQSRRPAAIPTVEGVKRYDWQVVGVGVFAQPKMLERKNGEFVLYADHVAALASLPKPEARPEGEGETPEVDAAFRPVFADLHRFHSGDEDLFEKVEAAHKVTRSLERRLRSPGAGAWRPMETAAVRDVLAERRRQVEKEGWTPEHDDEHARGVLAVAGACYALAGGGKLTESPSWQAQYQLDAQRLWPFDEEWYKPRDPRRDLLRAAALILAEIERLDRAQPPTTGEAG